MNTRIFEIIISISS